MCLRKKKAPCKRGGIIYLKLAQFKQNTAIIDKCNHLLFNTLNYQCFIVKINLGTDGKITKQSFDQLQKETP
ncbi:hypothetical protein AUQ44_00160 [Vibrio cidicii]|uniref:Uncharacterized protein n=1 Tax=Vibrio cidicii TaxID=1763883 RepID=A0A151JF99_9VIBR|nr:hypothetical protein AUQ44_00160 [Vibrio cidicii]